MADIDRELKDWAMNWEAGEQFTPDLEEAKKAEKEAPWAGRAKELHKRLVDARTYLLLQHQFFGMIAMKMRFVITDKIPTAAVRADAVCMFNPDFMDRLDDAELPFLIAHELCHLAYCHFDRIGQRNPQVWNMAGDYMINRMLTKAGLKMPVGEVDPQTGKGDIEGLLDSKYDGWDDERIYAELYEDMKNDLNKQQQGQGDQCPECGGEKQDQQEQGGQGDNQEQDGKGQEQDGQGGGQGDDEEQDGQGQQQGQGGGDGDDQQQDGEQQGQGGGQGDDQQQGQGSGGQDDGQQQGQGGEDQCSTCGRSHDGQQQGQGGQGQGQGKGTGKGGWGTPQGDADFGATPDLKRQSQDGTGERVRTPTEWRQIVLQTASAVKRSRGDLPADIQRLVDELKDPQLPWDNILQRYLSDILQSGSSYQRPSRRSGALLHSPVWKDSHVFPLLPGPKPDRSPVVLAIDTSASRSEEELRDDLSETIAILRPYQRPIRAMTCDAAVQFDDYVTDPEDIELKGGGGTRLEKIWERLEEEPGQYGERPSVVIVFTDLMTSFPEEEPMTPTIWVYTGHGDPPEVPFGEVIELGPSKEQKRGQNRGGW